jgi:WD40 repeat protein
MNRIDGTTTSGPGLAHSNTINLISFTSDGTYIVSGSEDTTVKVWDAESGTLRHTFYALEGGYPLSINISPDGVYVVTSYGPDGGHYIEGTRLCPKAVIIREIQSGKTVKTLNGNYYGINSTAFSPDGQELLTASHYRDKSPIILWDLKKSRRIRTYDPFCSRMRFVSFLPDEKHFVAVGKLGYIALVDIDSGEIIRSREYGPEHQFFPHFVTLSPDRKKLLLGSDVDEYLIWDIESGQETLVDVPKGIHSFAISPDGLTLACGRQNGIDLYRFGTGQIIKTFPLLQTNVTALAFSPNGKHIAFGSDNNAIAYYSVTFKMLDLETSTPRYSIVTPVDATLFAVCDPDGEHLYTRASLNILKVWDTASGMELSRITGDWRDIHYADISPDGKYLAGALADSDTVKIWDAVTGSEIHSISTGLSTGIEALHFRCGGTKIIVFPDDHGPHIFDVKTGKLILSIPDIPGKTRRWQPYFNSSDDRYFAHTKHPDDFKTWDHETITVFDIETASEIAVFPLPENIGKALALYYTPGIALAALYKDNFEPDHPENKHHLTIVNAASGEILYSDTAPYINDDAITFSPTGESFTISYGRDLHLVPINITGGREIIHIPVNHQGNIIQVAYLPDIVISVSHDCINIADSKTGKLLRTINESTDLLLLPASTDGSFLVTASNSIIKTWNVKEKIQKAAFPVFGYPEDVACIPEGRKLFSVTDSIVHCHNTITGKQEYVFSASEEFIYVNKFGFRPGTDQALLYDSLGPMRPKIYNYKTGADLLTLEWEGLLFDPFAAYSYNGKFIVCCGGDHYSWHARRERTIFIIDADTGTEMKRTKKFSRSRDAILVLALSHNDKYLITGSSYHKIALWDFEKRSVIRTYTGHKDEINMVAFTHDDKRIVSSSDDTTMRIWDRGSAACLAVFPGIAEVIPESVSNPAWRFIAALTVHGTVKFFSKDTLEESAHIINFKDGSWVFS